MHEWPILVFTLLVQAAVGIALLTALYGTILKGSLDEQDVFVALRPSLAIMALLAIVGLAASFGHLGYVWNAPNAIRHIGTSWMSREIVLTSAFIGLAVLTTMYSFWQKRFVLAPLVLVVLVGLAAVYCMGQLYRATTVATWLPANTHVAFFTTVAIAGSVAYLLLPGHLTLKAGPEAMKRIAGVTLAIVAIAVAVQFVALPLFTEALPKMADGVVTYPHRPVESYAALELLRMARWIAAAAGVALFAYALWGATSERRQVSLSLSALAVLCLIAAESMGRYVFFAIG